MQAIETFNRMMGCFLEDMRLAFPDIKCIQAADRKFQLALLAAPKAPMDAFAAGIGPFTDKIQAHDDTFLSEDLVQQPWFEGTPEDAVKIAQSPPDNRKAIFDWLGQMAFLAVGVAALPVEGLEMVDNIVAALQNDEGAAEAMLAAFQGEGGLDLGALSGVLGESGAFAPA